MILSRQGVMGVGAVLALALGAPVGAFAQSALEEVASPGAAKHHDRVFREDVVDIALASAGDAGKGHELEYMIKMKAGDTLVYSWDAPQAKDIYHDFHGHTVGKVTFYKRATGAAHHGSMTAPFEGLHGWYLENRTEAPVVVRLKLSGFYELVAPGEDGNAAEIEANQPARFR